MLDKRQGQRPSGQNRRLDAGIALRSRVVYDVVDGAGVVLDKNDAPVIYPHKEMQCY